MVITPIGRVSQINGSQGQFIVKRVRFQSNEALTGKTIYFNPGLYTSSASASPVTSLYSVAYPAFNTVTEMTLLGSDSDQNYKVAIESLDAFTFEIIYSFFILPNQGGYQPASPISNNSFADIQSISGINVGYFVRVDSDTGSKDVPIFADRWCPNGTVEWATNLTNGSSTNGYIAGSDLVVSFGTQGPVSSNFFVGFYRKSSIGNNDDIVSDLEMHYAEVSSTLNDVNDAVGNALPRAAITAGTPINQVGSLDAQGNFTIDGSYLINGTYGVYVVFQQGSQWKSCLLEISEGTVQECAHGDFEVTISDLMGNSVMADFATGLSECATVDVTVQMDKASYNAQLAALGFTGTYDDNFVGVSADVDGISINADNDTVTFQIDPAGLPGTRTINVVFTFEVDGEIHNITKQVTLNFGVMSTMITGETEDPLGNQATVICDEDEGIYTFVPDTPIAFDEIFSNLNGGDYTANLVNNSLELDTSTLNEGDIVCVKLLSTSGPIDTNECECPDCDDLEVQMVFAQDVPGEINAIFTFPKNGTILVTELIQNLSSSGTGSSVELAVQHPSAHEYFVQFTDEDGCEYEILIETPSFAQEGYTINVQMVKLTQVQPDCDCDTEDTDCQNSSVFTIACDEATQTIDVDVTDTFASTILTDTITVQIGNGVPTNETFPYQSIGNEEIIVRRTVVFDDDCELYMEQRVVCEEYDGTPPATIECDYSVFDILCSYDTDTEEFSVTTTGDTSNLVLNNIVFTLNGSAEIPYNGPVQGLGLFVAHWDIQINDCEAVRLTSYCSIKNCCNPFDLDCDDVCDLDGGIVTCMNGILTFAPNATDTTDWTFEWFDSGNNSLGTGLTLDLNPALTPDTYTLQATHPTCTDFSVDFVFDGNPNAGASTNPAGNPVIIT